MRGSALEEEEAIVVAAALVELLLLVGALFWLFALASAANLLRFDDGGNVTRWQ